MVILVFYYIRTIDVF
ncbi:hypothetical protein YPPY19_1798, partial [Yersinia pestis PY-19]